LCFFCVLLLQHIFERPALAALVCAPSMACLAWRSANGTWLAPARLPGAVRRGWRTGLGCVHAVSELAIHGSPASAGARVARGVWHGFGKFTAARWKAEAKQRTSTPTERKWLIGNGSGSGGCHYKTAKRQAKRARPTFPF
jgi:hypothetical protein